MVVEVLVELVPLDKTAAEDNVSVLLTVQEETVEMMVAEETPVVSVLPHKHVPMDNVLELQQLTVLEEFVAPTVPEEAVAAARLDKDAGRDNANATMTVMNETVAMQFNPMEATLVCAHKDLAAHVPVDSLVEVMEDALHRPHVMF